MGDAQAKLYEIPGSHAVRCTKLMLAHKGIPYETVMLTPGFHAFVVRARFPQRTVPALVIDGRKVQTNREIAPALDELQPEPPLFPADPERRRAVEEAMRWGDEVLQPLARRLVFAPGLRNDLDELVAQGADGRLGTLLADKPRRRLRIAKVAGKYGFGVSEDQEREDLAALPAALDKVDAWIGEGVLGGEELNAADFIIAPCVALIAYRHDLRPDVESRPAGALAERLLPEPQSVAAT
jgi:glutathione S-transferase